MTVNNKKLTTEERVYLSNKRIEMSRLLNDMKQIISEVSPEQRKTVFKTEIEGLKTLEGTLIGGNRILYNQIKSLSGGF